MGKGLRLACWLHTYEVVIYVYTYTGRIESWVNGVRRKGRLQGYTGGDTREGRAWEGDCWNWGPSSPSASQGNWER